MQQLIDLMYPSHSPERRKLREEWNETDRPTWDDYLYHSSRRKANRLIAEFMEECINEDGKMLLHSRFPQRNYSEWADYTTFQEHGGEYPLIGQEDGFGWEYLYSWDWLMPVVDKIETLGHRFAMDYTPGMFKPYAPGLYGYVEFKISRGAITWAWKPELNEEQATKGNWTTTRIQAVYMTVVEFILWYNKTQENEH